MLLRPRSLVDVADDPRATRATLASMRAFPNGAARAGVGRHYIVDWEFAWFFKLPIDIIAPFVPPGMRPFQPDAQRKYGLIHLGYIKMRPGNLRSESHPRGLPAFEELTWGVQAQPYERDWKLPYTFVANRLAGNHRTFREVSRDVDHYPIYDTDDIQFRPNLNEYSVSVVADGKTICELSLGATLSGDKAEVDRRYAVLPVPAEVVKPGPNGTLYRNTFNFLGLVRRIEAHELDTSAVHKLHDHAFFDGLFASPLAIPIPYAVMMSRPGTLAAQIIGATRRVR